jgi:uncharacterized protein (UPF0218 family)
MSRRIVHLRSKIKSEIRNKMYDEMRNEMKKEIKNKMRNKMRNDVLSENKVLSAIVDFTSSFLVRVVSIFFNSKDDHETRKIKC